MSAYLLTWNPTLFTFGDRNDASCNIGDEIIWSCYSQQPKIDDTVYLVRVGQEPRCLVAKGVVTRESFFEPDFRNPSQTKRKIRFRFEDVRLDQSEGSLPLLVLQKAFPDQKWNPKFSGIAIEPEYVTELDQLWAESHGKHSITVALRWLYDNLDSEQWKQPYQEACERAQRIKLTQEVSDEDLDILWYSRKDKHPIATVRSNGISRIELDQNRDLLKELTLSILHDPSPRMYDAVCQKWGEWKKEGLFKSTYWTIINRFFAAADPVYQLSGVENHYPIALAERLKSQFLIHLDNKGNWSQVGKNIIESINPLLDESWDPYQRNIALWNLYKNIEDNSETEESGATMETVNSFMQSPQLSGSNTIFYGPPGTGKTHRVIEAAVSAAKPEFAGCKDREQLKAEYDSLLKSGRIRFVTFHQSFSYEEFIEGLRAETNDAGQISYRVTPGIFKQICTDATFGATTLDSPLENAIEAFKTRLETEQRVTLTTKRGNSFGVEFHGNKTFRAFPAGTINDNLDRGYPVSIEHIWNEYQGINRERIYNPSYVKAILGHLVESYDVPTFDEPTSASEPEPFVLIIDEINRGNISKIFGELITLIESSKRAGQPEALSVQLPYSGDTFTVPSNLHIIGTMNTADRSLATMDTALRRRFDFIEIMPDYTQLNSLTVKGINMGALLRTLNDRIEYLYDREHTLGHAFFMTIAKKESDDDRFNELASIFKKKILPLLQEYFFEDWEKIRLILGDNQKDDKRLQFVTHQEVNTQQLFGALYAADQYADERKVYVINADAFSAPEAYLQIAMGSSPVLDAVKQ